MLKLLLNIVHRLNQLGSLLNQLMATAHLRRVDRARNGKHLPPLLNSQPRSNKRARLQGSFYHQHPMAQASNNAIALWKMVR